ncbi:hypothetical protein EMCG_09013 [[Emmonsia] crescens]|uniref:Uncharacterized protein n=1 Tax=[Emmonsia] crescens TaxID=73230 RepID=A0A0G2JA56_9EURO|nr:hypothetical protein EMCG_09013 [Emmonsia crescens UAMH 3008]
MPLPTRHIIFKRARGSRRLRPQRPATEKHVYIALALLDTALDLLSTRTAKTAMAMITRLFDDNLPVHLQIFRDILDAGISFSIDRFVEIMQIQTPLVIIDGNLTDPGNPAYHHRETWTGNFDPLEQHIILNKELVEDMVDAESRKVFRRFQFQFHSAAGYAAYLVRAGRREGRGIGADFGSRGVWRDSRIF